MLIFNKFNKCGTVKYENGFIKSLNLLLFLFRRAGSWNKKNLTIIKKIYRK